MHDRDLRVVILLGISCYWFLICECLLNVLLAQVFQMLLINFNRLLLKTWVRILRLCGGSHKTRLVRRNTGVKFLCLRFLGVILLLKLF